MGLTTVGATLFAKALMGESITTFTTANTYVGVGDSSTAFDAAQTDLQAVSNKVRVLVDSITRVDNVITIQATFGSSVGNFDWTEVGVFNAASGGDMLRRKVVSLGTKVSGNVRVLTLTLTV